MEISPRLLAFIASNPGEPMHGVLRYMLSLADAVSCPFRRRAHPGREPVSPAPFDLVPMLAIISCGLGLNQSQPPVPASSCSPQRLTQTQQNPNLTANLFTYLTRPRQQSALSLPGTPGGFPTDLLTRVATSLQVSCCSHPYHWDLPHLSAVAEVGCLMPALPPALPVYFLSLFTVSYADPYLASLR